MLVTVEKWLSKFEYAVAEQIRIAEEREQVYPVTYKCPKCRDKKWFVWSEKGYEYGEPCECQEREWRERREERNIHIGEI